MREFVGVHVVSEPTGVSEQSGAHSQPGIATLLISREPTNALTRQAYRELASAAAEVGHRADVAAVILFGGHDIFCAGDDGAELLTLSPAEAGAAEQARSRAIDAVAAIGKPTVAAITGYALGAGLSLALAADWRVCGDNAKFGATEILDGRVGGCARLARAVGPWRAKELAFSGRFVGAEEALALGLVDELCAPDHVYDTALSWARRFVDAPPSALAAIKARIDSGFDSGAG